MPMKTEQQTPAGLHLRQAARGVTTPLRRGPSNARSWVAGAAVVPHLVLLVFGFTCTHLEPLDRKAAAMKCSVVKTIWPQRGEVAFTVLENGVITDVYPADSPLAERLSSIVGFDIPGATPLPTVAHAAVQVGEAVRGEVDVTGCSVVARPRRGSEQPLHYPGRVVSVEPAPAGL